MNSLNQRGALRRRLLGRLLAGSLVGGAAPSARALMAGRAPDSPAARVDPNTRSSRWSGVVCVLADGSPYSGVAIGPRHVLTASHVVGGRAPAQLQVVLNHTAPPLIVAVAATSVYPGATFPYDDLALLQLAQALPLGVATYPVMDLPRPVGTALTLVGYGASGLGDVGPTVPPDSAVKRTGMNVIDQFTDRLDSSGRTSPFFVYDFDGASGNGPLGGPTLGNALETTVAVGDSGCGAFVMFGDEPALYGLNNVALSFNGAALSTFGSGGAGLILGYKPYLDWLVSETASAVELLSKRQPDSIPAMPTWTLAALGGGLWWIQRRQASPRGAARRDTL